jgi:hypothetical protein
MTQALASHQLPVASTSLSSAATHDVQDHSHTQQPNTARTRTNRGAPKGSAVHSALSVAIRWKRQTANEICAQTHTQALERVPGSSPLPPRAPTPSLGSGGPVPRHARAYHGSSRPPLAGPWGCGDRGASRQTADARPPRTEYRESDTGPPQTAPDGLVIEPGRTLRDSV